MQLKEQNYKERIHKQYSKGVEGNKCVQLQTNGDDHTNYNGKRYKNMNPNTQTLKALH